MESITLLIQIVIAILKLNNWKSMISLKKILFKKLRLEYFFFFEFTKNKNKYTFIYIYILWIIIISLIFNRYLIIALHSSLSVENSTMFPMLIILKHIINLKIMILNICLPVGFPYQVIALSHKRSNYNLHYKKKVLWYLWKMRADNNTTMITINNNL